MVRASPGAPHWLTARSRKRRARSSVDRGSHPGEAGSSGEVKRFVRGTQPTGRLTVGHLDPCVVDRPGDDHEGRQWTPCFEQPRRHGSNVRVLLARSAKPPGLQKLMPGLMDRRGLMVNRTHKRQAIHPRGKTGQMLADPNSGNAGGDRAEGAPDLPRCIGLWVPCLKLAWSAHQHQQDDRPVPPSMIPREHVQIGQAEAERAQPHAPYAQEVAAADTGTGSHHARTDRDHRGLSSLAPAKPTDLTTLTGVQRTWAVSSATGASRFSRSVWRYCLPLVGEK